MEKMLIFTFSGRCPAIRIPIELKASRRQMEMEGTREAHGVHTKRGRWIHLRLRKWLFPLGDTNEVDSEKKAASCMLLPTCDSAREIIIPRHHVFLFYNFGVILWRIGAPFRIIFVVHGNETRV